MLSLRFLLLLSLALLWSSPVLADLEGDDDFDDIEGDDEGYGDEAEESAESVNKKEEIQVEEEPYVLPTTDAFLSETFATSLKESGWVPSKDAKFAEGSWRVGAGKQEARFSAEKGLIVEHAAKHHAISKKFSKPFDMKDQDLIVQYEVRFHNHHECGGAYLKLLRATDEFSPETFNNDDDYVIMFGPDKCGTTDKVHFIFRHKNPVSGEFEEKHAVEPATIRNDRQTHVYTLIVRKDNTFEILIDSRSVRTGKLLEDFEPPVNPAKMIDDPEDKKPEDWVDQAKINDPESSKPDDWDEDALPQIADPDAEMPENWDEDAAFEIPDPEAEEPEDWDEEMDGEWEAPLIENPICKEAGCGPWSPPDIPNPDFKGRWIHPQVDNPDYIGEWKPKQIENPHFFVDEQPHALEPMGAIGFEIWTMQDEIEFDNIFIDSSEAKAEAWRDASWAPKNRLEVRHQVAKDAASRGESDITAWINDFAEMATENPIPVGITALIGLLSTIAACYYMCGDDEEEIYLPEATETKEEDAEEEETKEEKNAEDKKEE